MSPPRSGATAVDAILARLLALHPKRIDLSLDRVERLLAALDHPEEKLPEGFQRAEYLKDHGMVDMVVHRHDLRPTLARLCRLLTKSPTVEVGSKSPASAPAPLSGADVPPAAPRA